MYTNWDAYIATNQFISNSLLTRVWWRALADTSVLRYTWHMHVNMALNLITSAAHVLYIRRQAPEPGGGFGLKQGKACDIPAGCYLLAGVFEEAGLLHAASSWLVGTMWMCCTIDRSQGQCWPCAPLPRDDTCVTQPPQLLACTPCAACLRHATCRHRCTYMRQRHRLVVAQRMLRLSHMLLSVYQSCEELQAALARALDAGKVAAAATPTLRVAVLNLTRPLGLGPMITMSQVSTLSFPVVFVCYTRCCRIAEA